MPVHNEDIAVIFEEIADLLEIEEANPFRVRAYRTAARTIRGLSKELGDMVAHGEDLTELPAIGDDLAAKIGEILKTGTTAALKKLHKEIPAGLEELLKIPGLGPKRVKTLFTELDIKTLKQLEKAARSGRLQELPGFGAKTEGRILEAIDAHRTQEKRFSYAIARQYAESLVAYLRDCEGVKEVVVAGSYRRGKETLGDLDILVTAGKGSPVMDRFVSYEEVASVISKGPTRAAVILHCGLQVDLRVVEPESFGAALHYFTGSKAHNIQVRRMGQQRGLKINEYGVFKGEQRVTGADEESVFKSVGLPFIPPELREDRGEIEAAQAHRLPRLIELIDLKGDLHVHTLATDGHADIKAMAMAAKRFGLSYIAITDHSQNLTVVHGLNRKRLEEQCEQIDALNGERLGITLIKGIEVDILENGGLDLPDAVLSKLDLVIGAVHGHFRLPIKKQTERILRAMDHKYFSILAHPTGRLLMERAPYEVDMRSILEKAQARGCFVELNAQPMRLDLTEIHCQMAKEIGVTVCINSDSHNEQGFDNLRFGINQARRGWLEKTDVLNTRPLNELKKRLMATMG